MIQCSPGFHFPLFASGLNIKFKCEMLTKYTRMHLRLEQLACFIYSDLCLKQAIGFLLEMNRLGDYSKSGGVLGCVFHCGTWW